jgi:hypothetical protein
MKLVIRTSLTSPVLLAGDPGFMPGHSSFLTLDGSVIYI